MILQVWGFKNDPRILQIQPGQCKNCKESVLNILYYEEISKKRFFQNVDVDGNDYIIHPCMEKHECDKFPTVVHKERADVLEFKRK